VEVLAGVRLDLVGGLAMSEHPTTRREAVRPDLSPGSGAWFGWYLSGNANPTDKEAAYGRQADALRRYYSMSQSSRWPIDPDLTVARDDDGRCILFASVSNRCNDWMVRA